MPVLSLPPSQRVRVEWYGDQFSRRVQNSLRAALNQVGAEALRLALEPDDGVKRDTATLAASIRYKVPRRASGTQVYQLLFGVFPGEGAAQVTWPGPHKNTALGENPEDYAYWQEVDPYRGRSYIRVPMAKVMPRLEAYIRAEYAYRRTGETPGSVAFTTATSGTNFGQTVGEASRETEEYYTQRGGGE